MHTLYGIIGYPLGHSRSPRYFNDRFREAGIDAEYLPFELEDIRALPALLEAHPELRGFNVTIPHKQNIIPYINSISEEARAVGAVNCVKVTESARGRELHGYNTDVAGFRKALLDFLPRPLPKALILGNGGAAKAVRHVLRSLQTETLTVSRTPRTAEETGYDSLPRLIGDYPLIVNTTPLGTWPKTEECPDLPYRLLTPDHYLFDLIYNPETTLFLQQGAAAGAHTCNGYAMWLGQAEANWEIWF